jgi:hypothetical protein
MCRPSSIGSPLAAASSAVAGLVAATTTGGCGRVRERGTTVTSRNLNNVPAAVTAPPERAGRGLSWSSGRSAASRPTGPRPAWAFTDSLTGSYIKLAHANGIPVVGVYETMPTPGTTTSSGCWQRCTPWTRPWQDFYRAPVRPAPRGSSGRRTRARPACSAPARLQPPASGRVLLDGRPRPHRARGRPGLVHPGRLWRHRKRAVRSRPPSDQQSTSSGFWLRSCAAGEVNSARAARAAGRNTAARWQFWNASRIP